MEECGTPSPFPHFIRRRGQGSAAPLGQSSHQRRRESGPTRCPNQQWLSFPPPPLATPSAWRTRGECAELRGRVKRPLSTS